MISDGGAPARGVLGRVGSGVAPTGSTGPIVSSAAPAAATRPATAATGSASAVRPERDRRERWLPDCGTSVTELSLTRLRSTDREPFGHPRRTSG